MRNHESKPVVGMDVSKDKLDFYFADQDQVLVADNDVNDIQSKLEDKLDRLRESLVIVEATGSYEQTIVDWLHENRVPVAVVNPRQVRDFAKGIGCDAKTDPIDARVLARYS